MGSQVLKKRIFVLIALYILLSLAIAMVCFVLFIYGKAILNIDFENWKNGMLSISILSLIVLGLVCLFLHIYVFFLISSAVLNYIFERKNASQEKLVEALQNEAQANYY